MARSLAPLPANSQGPTSGTRPGGREISLPASLACLPTLKCTNSRQGPTSPAMPPPAEPPNPRGADTNTPPPSPAPLANHPEDSR